MPDVTLSPFTAPPVAAPVRHTGGVPLGTPADERIGVLRAMARPRLFVISGPSGVGKDAVIDELRHRVPEAYFAVTATTRAIRDGEVDGTHYFFLTEDEFETRRDDHEFLEWATVYAHHYGTPRGPIRDAIHRHQDVIVKVDVQGAASIRALVPEAITVFLAPESMAELHHRLKSRKTEVGDALARRFATASAELQMALDFDYVIFNEAGRLDQTVDQIVAVILAERCRVAQRPVAV